MKTQKYALNLKIKAFALWGAFYIFLGLISGGTLAIILYALL